MRIDTSGYRQWPDRDEVTGRGSQQASGNRKQGASVNTVRRARSVEADAGKAANDANTRLATQLVMSSELASAYRSFTAATDAIGKDLAQGKDTTDNAIKAAAALCDIRTLLSMEVPPPDMQEKIARVAAELGRATKDDTPETIGKRANVELSSLGQPPSDLSRYANYGKNASSYARNLIFGLSRFSNSEVLARKGWFKDWRAGGKAMMAWIGDEKRLGALLATRANAAGSAFVKGTSLFISGLSKLSRGEDPTRDLATAAATIGQGINETIIGAGTDLGNYLAKSRTAAAGPTKTEPSTEIQKSDSSEQLDRQIDERSANASGHVDEQVTAQQNSLREGVIKRVEGKHPDVQQLELQDAVAEVAPEYIQLDKLGKSIKASIDDAARDAHENIKAIDGKANEVVSRLKAEGFDSVDAARSSNSEQARKLCAQLDDYARLKREAYDHFNLAMTEREEVLKMAKPAFSELGQALKATPASARAEKIQSWSEKYGKFFAGEQEKFLAVTNTWPDWLKISKPLRMQLIPASINTVLGAIPFGFTLDDYLKKQQAGKVTTKDQLALGAAVMNFIAGPIGFVPCVGPFLSFAFATIGAICGGAADQFDQRKYEEYVYNLQRKCRDEFNAKHPAQAVAEPYDGD
jgi:hypothetical protein